MEYKIKFVNKGKPVQIRQDDGPGRFKWKLVKTGEIINLLKSVGKANGFKIVKTELKLTEGKIGKKKVETKQIDSKNKLKKKYGKQS
ncbi:MAG: hypothetical protein QQN41_00060 [Nitrosopumilus sp.]